MTVQDSNFISFLGIPLHVFLLYLVYFMLKFGKVCDSFHHNKISCSEG